jgi:hypothetical protein
MEKRDAAYAERTRKDARQRCKRKCSKAKLSSHIGYIFLLFSWSFHLEIHGTYALTQIALLGLIEGNQYCIKDVGKNGTQ